MCLSRLHSKYSESDISPYPFSIDVFATVWDDIEIGERYQLLSDIDYNPGSLSNAFYLHGVSVPKQRALLKKHLKTIKQNPGLFADFGKIRAHEEIILDHPAIIDINKRLFKGNLTSLEALFVNVAYRKVLRAKLEDSGILPGQVITGYDELERDTAIIAAVELIEDICNKLGIPDTLTASTFPAEKLETSHFLGVPWAFQSNVDYWSDISSRAVSLFGEDLIPNITLSDAQFVDSDKLRFPILALLNSIFFAWSDTILVLKGETIEVQPSLFVAALLSKLV